MTPLDFEFGARRYRVRGLERNSTFERMLLNVSVTGGSSTFLDVFDLYSAKQRAQFVKLASNELDIEPDVLKADLGQLLLEVETAQAERLEAEQRGPQVPVLTEVEKQAALEVLCDPNLLERIVEDFERCGVVGERDNKLVAYLVATSRLLPDPLAVVVQSSSAAGKSALVDAVLRFMPAESVQRFSSMTGRALYYAADMKHRILALAEEEGASSSAYALKILQSDQELTVASTAKAKSGRTVVEEYKVEGPVALFTTTTASDIDPELMNRCLVLSVDEGPEQTSAIHAAQRHRETLEGLLQKEASKGLQTLHQNMQRLLEPIHVVNPFAGELAFDTQKTRSRRDHAKLLAFIRAITLLHQHQRPKKDNEGLTYIEATESDIDVAQRLLVPLLERARDDLPPQTRRLLGYIQGFEGMFTRRQLREASGYSQDQVRHHLARLVDLELVEVIRGAPGQRYQYRLARDCGPPRRQGAPGEKANESGGFDETVGLRGAS